jgi:NAD(P)-dependent dehydrogenase (short-subunit alcohol dehydrogenase family)
MKLSAQFTSQVLVSTSRRPEWAAASHHIVPARRLGGRGNARRISTYTINAVSPSIARHRFLDKTTSADLLDRLSAGEAFGRAAEPWEVAATIAFLASDYSSYLTGEVISVSSQHP